MKSFTRKHIFHTNFKSLIITGIRFEECKIIKLFRNATERYTLFSQYFSIIKMTKYLISNENLIM